MVDPIEDRFPYECSTRWSWTEVADWCSANIGQFDQDWYRYGTDIAWSIGQATEPTMDHYRFRTEQAAILFRLRWS